MQLAARYKLGRKRRQGRAGRRLCAAYFRACRHCRTRGRARGWGRGRGRGRGLHHGAQVLAQGQKIGRRAVPRRGCLARTRCGYALALGAALGSGAANLSPCWQKRLGRRRALGAAVRGLAVHDQDMELTATTANMKYDFAVDRQLRLGGDRERAQVGAHQCMALCIVTRYDAGQGAAHGQLRDLWRRVWHGSQHPGRADCRDTRAADRRSGADQIVHDASISRRARASTSTAAWALGWRIRSGV